MHGSTMIYLFVTPVALAMGLYLVPLQVGAPNLAGSRFALAGMWLLVFGGITMWSGFLVQGGAAQATWSGFDPLSNAINSPGKAMDSWIWGVVLATLGELGAHHQREHAAGQEEAERDCPDAQPDALVVGARERLEQRRAGRHHPRHGDLAHAS
jgi:hypothetical protein